MARLRILVLLAVMVGIALAGLSCGGDDDNGATGSVTGFSACKQFPDENQGAAAAAELPANRASVEYQYDGQDTLLLEHVNAGFNCCPGEILADISVSHNTIEVRERETEMGCRCDCLYDVDMKIRNLRPGGYTIKIVEPYLSEENEKLEFAVDLSSATESSYTVDRSGYPWPN